MTTVPPAKVSEVAKWLAANPNPDVSLLARTKKSKASQRAAAVRALAAIGTPAALDALVTHRPPVGPNGVKPEGFGADTFPEPVAKELVGAWSRFSRREFAERMFSGLRYLHFETTVFNDLTGIDAVQDLESLRIAVTSACDVTPLASCSRLSRLELWGAEGSRGLDAVLRMPSLRWVKLSVDQAGVDALVESPGIRRVFLAVGPAVDLRPLARMSALSRLEIFSDGRVADETTRAAILALVERGVEVCMYDSDAWAQAVGDTLQEFTRVAAHHRIVLTRDPARAPDLEMELRLRMFL